MQESFHASQALRCGAGMLHPSPSGKVAMRTANADRRRHERLLAIALLWLAIGGTLLMTTLVPAHTALLGWAPLLWLLVAPLALLLILEPGLPRALLRMQRTRRHGFHLAVEGRVAAGRRRPAHFNSRRPAA